MSVPHQMVSAPQFDAAAGRTSALGPLVRVSSVPPSSVKVTFTFRWCPWSPEVSV